MFEEGQLLVAKNGDNRVFTVKDASGDHWKNIPGYEDCVVLHIPPSRELYVYPKAWFRLAKDKEIEIGHRLP